MGFFKKLFNFTPNLIKKTVNYIAKPKKWLETGKKVYQSKSFEPLLNTYLGYRAEQNALEQQQGYSLEQMAQQNDYNQSNMQLQAQLNRNQYDYEFGKESPSVRVGQLRASGLNPGLMYGGQGAQFQGNVGTVSAPSSSTGSAPQRMFDFASALTRLRVAESEIKANEALADERSASAEEKRGLTKPSQFKMRSDEAMANHYDALTAKEKENERYMKALADMQEFQNSIQKELRDVTISSARQHYWNLVDQGAKLFQEVVALQNDNSLAPLKKQELENTIKLQLHDMIIKKAVADSTRKGIEVSEQQIKLWQELLEKYDAETATEQFRSKLQELLVEAQKFDNEHQRARFIQEQITGYVNSAGNLLKGVGSIIPG